MTLYGTIDGARIVLDNDAKAALRAWCAARNRPRVQIEITGVKRQRTCPQNRLYWECVTIMAEALGYTREELHATLRAMLLTDRGGALPRVRSTTDLTTVEFMEYLSHVYRLAAEHDIKLPDPGLTDEKMARMS
jgi:hypothetical protein